MRRFRIGEIVLCKCPDGYLEPGEIVETVTKNGRTEIVVRFPDDEKIWKCETILPEDIVIVSFEPKPCLENRSSWEQQHMEEINAVFGKDMSGYVLAIYDKLEEIEDDFENYTHNTDYCRKAELLPCRFYSLERMVTLLPCTH